MPSTKAKAGGKSKLDRKLMKIIENSSSEDDESEHELSHYTNDRVKLMKQVLKIIKPKKIKNMAPNCMKNLDNEEINSMLLEELLGISNKRLKYIFTGQNVDEDTSSSTDPEEETKPDDIISLDDITDDDFVIEIDSSNEESSKTTKHKKHHKIKQEPPEKKIKKEKSEKSRKKDKPSEKKEHKTEEENLMSVLELLELQARARAIKSQLALEASKKSHEVSEGKSKEPEAEEISDGDEDAIIIESPNLNEIIITSSESDNDDDSCSKTKQNNSSKESSEIGTEKLKDINICDDTQTENKVSKETSESNTTSASKPDSSKQTGIEEDKNTFEKENINADAEKNKPEIGEIENAPSKQSATGEDKIPSKQNSTKEDKTSRAESGTEENKNTQPPNKQSVAEKEKNTSNEENATEEDEGTCSSFSQPSHAKQEKPTAVKATVSEESEKFDHSCAIQEGLIINIDDDDIQAIDSN